MWFSSINDQYSRLIAIRTTINEKGNSYHLLYSPEKFVCPSVVCLRVSNHFTQTLDGKRCPAEDENIIFIRGYVSNSEQWIIPITGNLNQILECSTYPVKLSSCSNIRFRITSNLTFSTLGAGGNKSMLNSTLN